MILRSGFVLFLSILTVTNWDTSVAAEKKSLLTTAEKSDYESTSRDEDVVSFCEELAKVSKRVQLAEIGKSGEGRKLPLMVLSENGITSPTEINQKLVVLVFANIHAGEVDGKEAILMWSRDLLTNPNPELLKKLVILVVPMLNADGNEKVSKTNRREQNGPVNGVGVRENSAGFDLNRDFVKLETPEIRALTKTIREWDPSVIVDLHTTNGSYHRYKLTYDGPRHAAADDRIISAVRDKWLPEISKQMKKSTGFDSFVYGNFSRDRNTWESYPPLPRYGIQYFALRNRIGLLSESYSYASFKDRIIATRGYLEGIFDFISKDPDGIRKLLRDADKPRERIALRTKSVSLPKKETVLGFVEENKGGRRVPTKETKDYLLSIETLVEPTLLVERPYAYLLPSDCSKVIENLQRHGIPIEELTEGIKLSTEVYTIKGVTRAERSFQKHQTVQTEVTRQEMEKDIPKGTILVRTEHPLGTLASFLMEPQSEDGLTTWNFFDDYLKIASDFPVLRVRKETNFKTKIKLPIKD